MTGRDTADPPEAGDAFGAALLDALAGGRGVHIIERDDGFVEAMDASGYFAGPADWPEEDAAALGRVSGTVLDVGAGAGRHSLALQERGDRPTALDTSPGAVAVCRERGVEQTYLGTVEALAAERPAPFDAIILMGNNLALLGSAGAAGPTLDAMAALLGPGGLVVGTFLDPYLTDDPVHLAYHQRNRERGRFPGQILMRIRYRRLATDWFDWLFLSPNELGAVAARAGWRLEEATPPGPVYLAVLRPPRA